MTRDEIYDHLAQVYLGKRNKSEVKKRKEFNAWLAINIVITVVIFLSAFYGLTAFLAKKGENLQSSVIYALNNGAIRIKYDLTEPYPPVKTFSMEVPDIDISKYSNLNFSIRGMDEGSPGIIKVVIRNQKNEVASHFIHGVSKDWQSFTIPITEFIEISDWTRLTDVSFVFEAWNVDDKKGIVMIDDVSFSS